MSESMESAAQSAAARQLEALRRLQAQAEQRVQLGQQLFKAAEAHTAAHQDALEQVRGEQERLREQVQQDVAQSLHAYDQWVGQIDESFTRAIRSLEDRVDALTRDWEKAKGKIDTMVKRSEALLDQSRCLMDGVVKPVAVATPGTTRPTPIAKAQPAQPEHEADEQIESAGKIGARRPTDDASAGPRYLDLIRKLRPESDSPHTADQADDENDEDRPPLRRSA